MATYEIIQGESKQFEMSVSWASSLTSDHTAALIITKRLGATAAVSKSLDKNDGSTAFVIPITAAESDALNVQNYQMEVTVTDASVSPSKVKKIQHVLSVKQKAGT